jgi:hypothetical protein
MGGRVMGSLNAITESQPCKHGALIGVQEMYSA